MTTTERAAKPSRRRTRIRMIVGVVVIAVLALFGIGKLLTTGAHHAAATYSADHDVAAHPHGDSLGHALSHENQVPADAVVLMMVGGAVMAIVAGAALFARVLFRSQRLSLLAVLPRPGPVTLPRAMLGQRASAPSLIALSISRV